MIQSSKLLGFRNMQEKLENGSLLEKKTTTIGFLKVTISVPEFLLR